MSGFWDWIFCKLSGVNTHDPQEHENDYRNNNEQFEHNTSFCNNLSQSNLDESLKRNLQSYKQTHVLSNILKLPDEKKTQFLKELEFVQFDLVDS